MSPDDVTGANALASGIAAGSGALETPIKAPHRIAATGTAVPTGLEADVIEVSSGVV